MGRLDEQAKNRIVVLRKAGLSFRKIKKVLELDNIKVTPQAIYLFLKRKNIEPEKSVSAPQTSTPKAKPWVEGQLWNLMQENGGQCNGLKNAGQAVGEAAAGGGRSQPGRKEEGIKIVSVTSLSQGNQTFPAPSSIQRAIPGGQKPPETPLNSPRQAPILPVAPHQYHGRARTPLPAPKNPALLVTKKIVDRAIHLQKKVISQNAAPVLAHSPHYPPHTSLASRPPTMRPVANPCSMVKDASIQTSPSVPPLVTNSDQLDSIRGEIHRLTQAVQTLMDRQNRWEQEQHRQRQCNHQEMILQIQQLGASLTSRCTQNCGHFNSTPEPEPPLPDIGHFKMELL
ncbi:uncharacterized protein RCH25_035995 isoform 2-T2 [Pelodytes ibericus]